MQDDPRYSNRATPQRLAAWMTLVAIARLSYMKSAGWDELAKMPPTLPAQIEFAPADREDFASLPHQPAHHGRAHHAGMPRHPHPASGEVKKIPHGLDPGCDRNQM